MVPISKGQLQEQNKWKHIDGTLPGTWSILSKLVLITSINISISTTTIKTL